MDSSNWKHDAVSRILFGLGGLMMFAVAYLSLFGGRSYSPGTTLILSLVASVLFVSALVRMRMNA